jgi:hypothetical protein
MKKTCFQFIFLLISIVSFAQSPALQYISSTTGGGCYTVKYYNNHLFAGTGSTVKAYATDPVTGLIGNFLTEKRLVSNVTDMKMYGTHLIVSADNDGIYMLSTSSLPNALAEEAHYLPDSISEAAYNLAIKGDTLFVASKRKMIAYTMDTVAHTITLINRFGQLTSTLPNARVRGCDVKGNLLAYTVSTYSTTVQSDAITGIYIVNAGAINYPLLNFHQQTFADPEDVIFGVNTNLLHVMGGTESYAQPNKPEGIFYSLDITNPSSPVQIFVDTIGKTGVTLPYIQTCNPMKAVNINDTIYVAALGAPDTSNAINPAYGHTYVYKAISNSQVNCIQAVYAGLWHFDVAVNKKKMYVASEWYGIKTIDLTTLLTGGTDLGNHLTGGWNKGGDRRGNKLLQANEGYGFRTYDISNPSAPTFTGGDTVNQFCWGASYSGDGNYIYGHYYSSNDFRVFDANTFQLVGSADAFALFVDPRRSRSWQNKAVSIYHVGISDNVVVINAANPSSPVFEYNRVYPFTEKLDIDVDTSGNLYIMRDDSISVYDLTTSSHALKAKIIVPGGTASKFVTIAAWHDTVYAVVDHWVPASEGIYKFYFNGTNQLTQVGGPYPLPVATSVEWPKYIAADSFGVYVVYQINDLRALRKGDMVQTASYKHGGVFFRDSDYGPQDLFSKEGILFLNEYFSQTSMFYTDSSIMLGDRPVVHQPQSSILIYPNPTSESCTIALPTTIDKMTTIEMIDVMGRIVKTQTVDTKVNGRNVEIDMTGIPSGVYLVRVSDGSVIYSGRVVKE